MTLEDHPRQCTLQESAVNALKSSVLERSDPLQYFDRLTAGELDGRPDSWSFAAMALACRSGEQFPKLLEIYREMRRRRLPIYRDVYFSVLEACERLGLWQQGRDTLLQMQVSPF